MVCERPFYEILTGGGANMFEWLGCPYAIGGLTFAGVGLFIIVTGVVGLKNWSESWTVPMVWVGIMAPALGATLLPGVLLRRIAGVLTLAVAGILIGLYWWFGRA